MTIGKVAATAAALTAPLAAWYGWSRRYQAQPVLTQAEARSHLAAYVKRMHITADLDALEDIYITANGVRLHLAVHEAMNAPKNAPTIVFIPGTAAYAYWYIELFTALRKAGFNVVGLDPRGHGQSSGRRGYYTVDEIVDDTLAAVDFARERFGGPVALVGSSQGGISAFYAAARDDSIAAIVCDGFADLNGTDNLVLSSFRPPAPLIPVVRGAMRLLQDFSFHQKLYLRLDTVPMKDGTDLETYYADDPLWVDNLTFRGLLSLSRTPLAKPVEEIRVPVMLLHADRDDVFPRDYVEGIYARITAPKNYLYLTDTEHLVTVSSVGTITPEITRWIRSVLPVPASA